MSKKSIIVFEKDIVVKKPIKWVDIVYYREVYWLNIIKNSDVSSFPKILNCDDINNKIFMNNCGERINKKNCPRDWQEQANIILKDLCIINCCHNDIKPTDILVKDNKIFLIDFGWATQIGEKIPDTWPSGLGGEFKGKSFDDKFSLFKSINFILCK